DDQIAGSSAIGQRAGELSRDNGGRAARFALGAGLADTNDRDKPGAPSRHRLGTDIGIGLAAGVAAFGMADDRVAATGILQHLGADTAGKGTFWLGMTILPAEPDATASKRLADRHKQCRRGTDQEVAAMWFAGPLGNA